MKFQFFFLNFILFKIFKLIFEKIHTIQHFPIVNPLWIFVQTNVKIFDCIFMIIHFQINDSCLKKKRIFIFIKIYTTQKLKKLEFQPDKILQGVF
jgi:hypothetical protein